jgi:RHS repeat-associated protein
MNGANQVNFTYYADGLLTGAGSLTLARDPSNGLLTGTSLSSSGTTQSYNSFGEVSHFSANQGASAVLDIDYQRDDLGRIVQKTETVGGLTDTYAYGYDTAGRLTLVGKNGSTTASYAYDANGNRLSRTTPSTTETGTYDNQDRLLTYRTKTYTYTANGELSTKTDTATSQTTQYTYDALGNLNTVLLPDGRRVDYLVDGRNRRVAKKVNGAFAQKFLYNDQLRIAAELSASNAVVSRFVYATRVNVPDYLVKGSSTYRIVTDHLGSPRLVIDVSTGTIAQRMDYDEFGRVILDTNPAFQPLGFAGGLYDADTGLVRFGARDYDAEAGRWTAKDPIGTKMDVTNLFGYVDSDPIDYLDYEGESKTKGILKADDPYLRRIQEVAGDRAKLRQIEKEAEALWRARKIRPERWKKIRAWLKLAKDGRLLPGIIPCLSTVDCTCINYPLECAEVLEGLDSNDECKTK